MEILPGCEVVADVGLEGSSSSSRRSANGSSSLRPGLRVEDAAASNGASSLFHADAHKSNKSCQHLVLRFL